MSLRQRSVEQSAEFESRRDFGVVIRGVARVGLELHGGHRPHSYGASLPFRRL